MKGPGGCVNAVTPTHPAFDLECEAPAHTHAQMRDRETPPR